MGKDKILIFGAGKGGYYTCSALRPKYEVLGFLDNSEVLHGSELLGKKVYAPSSLNSLSFDRIVIASMYRNDIFKQLVDLGIEEAKIEVVDPEIMDGRYSLSGTKAAVFALGITAFLLSAWWVIG